MGVGPLVPDPSPGRVWRRPRVGRLVGLRPQPSIDGPSTAWTHDPKGHTTYIDVGYQLTDGIDAGRSLDCSLRTQLIPDAIPHRLWARQHAEEFAREPLAQPITWAPIVVTVDGLRIPAEQAIATGWELITLTYNDRFLSIVTSVLDADRFEPDYATFQPWPDDAPGVFDPKDAPPRLRQARHQHYMSGEITAEED